MPLKAILPVRSCLPLLVLAGALICCVAESSAADDIANINHVNGNLILFNPNGAWSWYQDERAAIDTERGVLLVGSLANAAGVGGAAKDGDVEVAFFDLASRTRRIDVLHQGLTSYGGGDDHNTASLVVLPGGNYLALYTGHNNDNITFYRIYDTESAQWGEEQQFDWNTMPGGTDFATTYSNTYYLSAENRLYNIARSNDRSPNIMTSEDLGRTWSYGGQLTTSATVGYVNGYFKYASNGTDRIDFIATEHHPRDYNTSIFHGYVRDGKSHNSSGEVVDQDVLDQESIPAPDAFTAVFRSDPEDGNQQRTRAWTTDLTLDAAGHSVGLFTTRAGDVPVNTAGYDDHRLHYARYDGSRWHVYEVAKMGARLFRSEQDYTGLGAIVPSDTNRIYISTTVDPTSGEATERHEIYRGITGDGGQSWTWTAITRNSSQDNLRPIIPAWNQNSTAVIWWRGTMRSSQSYDAAVVGVIEGEAASAGKISYVDATAANTAHSDGEPLATRDPEGVDSATAGWQIQAGGGNEASVLAIGASDSEHPSSLKTNVSGLTDGVYDVFGFFWGSANEDARIEFGLAENQTFTYRSPVAQQAARSQFADEVQVEQNGRSLYRAYLGRQRVQNGRPLEVYIKDVPPTAGQQRGRSRGRGRGRGGRVAAVRATYDGIGYARVDSGTSLGD